MTRGSEKFKIRQTPGLGYRLLRAYADKAFLASYSRIQYVGLENIPENCALIFAPNHTNGLMDPLVAMSLGKPLAPMIFAARADMFRIPLLREILLSLYVTPVMRVRDGFSHLEENVGIMGAVSDRLCDGIPYCIMAEGTQRDKHSLLPLRKGIFRVALMTDDKLSGRMPVVIVPVGIEYGSYYRYRTSILVNVGKPMNVSEFRKSNKDLTQPALMNAMRDELTSKMKALYLSLDDDADYDGVLEVCRIVSEDRLLSAGRSAGLQGSRLKNAVVDGKFSLYDRMREDCLVAGTLYALRDSGDVAKQTEYSELVRLGKEAADRRARAHISAASYAGAVDFRLGFMNCRALSGVRRAAVMVLTFLLQSFFAAFRRTTRSLYRSAMPLPRSRFRCSGASMLLCSLRNSRGICGGCAHFCSCFSVLPTLLRTTGSRLHDFPSPTSVSDVTDNFATLRRKSADAGGNRRLMLLIMINKQ